jgi:multidrug transporter EmrE-like cation transporter
MNLYLLLAVIAALSYTVGGVFMKLSEGFSNLVPSLLVYLLFLVGASLQTYLTNNAHLGITYILVLGLETVCTVFFSLLVFKEGYSTLTIVGIFLIIIGAAFLRAEAG